MYCKSCGSQLCIGIKFCPKCGCKVDAEYSNENKNTEVKKNKIEEKIKSIDEHFKENIYIRAMELSELPEYKDKKVTKIKILREEFGIGLVEAKTIIEEVEKDSFNFENVDMDSQSAENTDEELHYNGNNEDYGKVLENYMIEEEKYNNYEYGVDFLIFIISMIYYMRNGEELIVSIISALLIASIASFVIVSRVFKSIKKEDGCYRAKEKYDKYNILKQSMEASVAIHMVNLEFDKSNQEKHGLLYYLVCIIAVILIFALC